MYESEVKSEVNTIFFCFGHSVLRQWCSRTLHKSSWLCFSAGLPGRKWWTQTCVHGLPGKKGGKKTEEEVPIKYTVNNQFYLEKLFLCIFHRGNWLWQGPQVGHRYLPVAGRHFHDKLSTASSQRWASFPCQLPLQQPATSIKGEGITSASSNSRHLNNETHIQEYQLLSYFKYLIIFFKIFCNKKY